MPGIASTRLTLTLILMSLVTFLVVYFDVGALVLRHVVVSEYMVIEELVLVVLAVLHLSFYQICRLVC